MPLTPVKLPSSTVALISVSSPAAIVSPSVVVKSLLSAELSSATVPLVRVEPSGVVAISRAESSALKVSPLTL